jgi:aspartate aminotransferase
MALAAGVTPVPYRLDRAADFALDPEAVEARVGPRTRAILVNSPSNPTGAVATRSALEEVVEVAGRHGLWVVSDECYEDIVFEGEHTSPAALGDRERVVSVFSFSKSYAMTGWRVGYVVAPSEVVRAIVKAQEPVVSSASTVSQKAAEAALLGPRDAVDAMRAAYRARRDLALSLLDERGVGYARPQGAFYLMVDVAAAEEPSEAFALRLLRERHVAVVPGSAFGEGGEGMVRVSLAASEDAIRLGLDGLAAELRPSSSVARTAAQG